MSRTCRVTSWERHGIWTYCLREVLGRCRKRYYISHICLLTKASYACSPSTTRMNPCLSQHQSKAPWPQRGTAEVSPPPITKGFRVHGCRRVWRCKCVANQRMRRERGRENIKQFLSHYEATGSANCLQPCTVRPCAASCPSS